MFCIQLSQLAISTWLRKLIQPVTYLLSLRINQCTRDIPVCIIQRKQPTLAVQAAGSILYLRQTSNVHAVVPVDCRQHFRSPDGRSPQCVAHNPAAVTTTPVSLNTPIITHPQPVHTHYYTCTACTHTLPHIHNLYTYTIPHIHSLQHYSDCFTNCVSAGSHKR